MLFTDFIKNTVIILCISKNMRRIFKVKEESGVRKKIMKVGGLMVSSYPYSIMFYLLRKRININLLWIAFMRCFKLLRTNEILAFFH